MKILAVSDTEISFIYSPKIAERFGDVDFVIGCGDLPHYYLEYIVSMLDIPVYYVHGNHAPRAEISMGGGEKSAPEGAIDLHQRCLRSEDGILLAGIEGSLRYNYGPRQYTQSEMWMAAFQMSLGLFYNRMRYGRYLDILVTHAAPWKIHDMDDLPHQGIKAFRWLIKVFKPIYHLHGHIHLYRNNAVTETHVDDTRVINTFGYREIILTREQIMQRTQLLRTRKK